MKKLIMRVLEKQSGQTNLDSSAARERIADDIIDEIRAKDNGGWFLDLGTYPPKKPRKQ
tara:strand:+ start:1662 stop:1838 length:177 start_codon:yes stop_codon:yes gene_type:complete